MSADFLSARAAGYVNVLCLEDTGRRVGTPANRVATELVAGVFRSAGFETECPRFDCLHWVQEGASLRGFAATFEVQASPFSPGCEAQATLAVVSTVEELEGADLSERIVLLRGEIAKEQLMPKNFDFYNPDEHKRIVAALEAARPLAVVAATSRDPGMAGAVYPFPLIEDGDFDIPSVYMTDVEGERLAGHAGGEVYLRILARRVPATGCNVIARKRADADRRVVLFAHIDTKEGTPGALDNAGGVTVLLLLAELLAGYDGKLGIELVAMNGEDYYAVPGEKQWLAQNEGRFGEIVLGINLDGVAHREGRTAFSLYGCPPEVEATIRDSFAGRPSLIEGEAWYQSDHSLFLAQGIPALAMTSQRFTALWSEVAHTAEDRVEIVDPEQLVELALALRDLLLRLD